MSASSGNRALTIPKFASFKPNEAPPEDREESRGREEVEGHKRRDRRSDHGEHRHGKRRRHDSHRSDDQRRHSRSPRRRAERHPEPEPTPSKKVHSDVFFVDVKGDPLISRYGGIDRSQIPSYYRHGGGRILGSVGRLVMHRDGPRDQFSIRMPGEGFYSSRDKDGLRSKSWRLKHQPKIVRTIREDVTTTNEEDAGYISLQPARKRRRLDEDTDSSEEDDTPAYRAIERKAGGKQSQGSDTSDDEEEGITPAIDQRNPLQWRSIQLNRQVKDHPEDIKAWLELVNHQDVLLRAGEDMDHQVLEHEVHSFTEIKVSMLESALLHATIPTDRVLILNRLMQEGCKVWNSKTALKKWEQVRKDEDDNFTLWITHLNYCMTDIASFRYDAVKEMLLDKLRQVLSRSASGPLQNVLQEAIYIFLRMTRFMHDAGFKELAVGAWQAMLELTFFRPSGVESKDSAMADFRDFWESEVPRIGEPGALGWNRYSEAGGEDPELQSAVDADAEAEPSRDAYESWANVERLQADKARMPARTMDEDNQDDPFRVVMYSDIEPLLFYIPGQELPLVQDQLLNGFLLFSGFPPFSQSNEWTQEACEDQFIMAARGSVESQTLPTPNVDDVDEPQRNNIAFAPISMHVAISADVHFPGPKWFRYLNEEAPHRALDAHWVHTTTQQLTFGAGVEELSIYQLALGLLDGEAGVKKLAKSLLKRYPSSLGLYNAYALAEFAGGHTDMAKRVLYSAVKLTTNDNGIFLWRTWSWIELELGNKWLAIKRLCSSVDTTIREAQDDDSAVPSTYILMADQAFKSNVHSSLSLGDINTAATWGECLGLLSYLVAEKPDEPMSSLQGNISAAMNSINWVCSELRSRGGASTTAHEGLLQFAARLLYWNAMQGPFRRAYMHDWLSDRIKEFPRNTIFLSLLAWSDSKLRVVDETRRLLYDTVLVAPQDCVSSRLFAIEHEMARGNANTTKAAFEHAVASDTCKGSAAVWIWYLRFCCVQNGGLLQPKVAKDVFYRALRHCPWSKDLMLEAFGSLSREMGSAELMGVYNTITSKGLRVHVDLDEFLERRRAEKQNKDTDREKQKKRR